MNIHEYQAKELLKAAGVAVLEGHVAWTPEEAVTAAQQLPGPIFVVKSQIHAGGRGAGRFADAPNGKGGVRLAKSHEDVREAAEAMLGHTLVTKQTGPAGKTVHRVYVEAGCDIARELYLSLLVDRANLPRAHHGLHRRRHGDRGNRRAFARENSPGGGRPRHRHLRLPCSRAGFRPRPRRQAGRRLHQIRAGHVQGLHRPRLRHRRDQSAGRDQGRRRGSPSTPR